MGKGKIGNGEWLNAVSGKQLTWDKNLSLFEIRQKPIHKHTYTQTQNIQIDRPRRWPHRLSVCTECIVYIQPIGSRVWEIDWYQNEWTWPLFRGRVKVMSTIALQSMLNISETVRDRGLEAWFKGPPIGNGIWGIKWSRDRWRHVTPKRAEAVRSAILATAWLLVY